MKKTLAIAMRVLKQLLRDKRTLALMFIAPILIMWLLNVMFSANTTTNVKLATVDLDSALVTQLDQTKHVTVKEYQSKDQAIQAVKNDHADAAIVQTSTNHYSITYANTDSSKTTMTKQVFQQALTKVGVRQLTTTVQTLAKATGTSVPSATTSTKITNHYDYGNSDTGFFTKMVPILMSFFIFFFVFLISGMALLNERTTGTLDRLLATPVRRAEIVFGYMLSYGLVAIVQTIVIVWATIGLLNIEVVGSIFSIVIITAILAFVALAFGILMSTFTNSEFQMMQFIPLVIVPQVFFSGIIPLDQMASWVQVIGKILPITYTGDALSQIILHGASITDLGGDILALLIFLIILTTANILGMKRYRKV